MKLETRGYLAVVGGFLIHFILGSLYLWGNINVYVASYLTYQTGEKISVHTINAVFPFIFQSGGIAVLFTDMTIKKIGVQPLCLICSILMSLAIFVSSFTSTLPLFVATYGIMYGFF